MHTNLGIALSELGKLRGGGGLRAGARLRPDSSAPHSGLGSALREQGNLGDAVTSYQGALALRPDCAKVQAIWAMRSADQASSRSRGELPAGDRPQAGLAEAHRNLGNALSGQGKIAEAVAATSEALALKPDSAEAHGNLGNALRDQGKLKRGGGELPAGHRLKPDFAEAYSNLGSDSATRASSRRRWRATSGPSP